MAITVQLVPADHPPPAGLYVLARIRCRQHLPDAASLQPAPPQQGITLPLPLLSGEDRDELWLVDEPVSYQYLNSIHTHHSPHYALSWCWLDQNTFATSHAQAQDAGTVQSAGNVDHTHISTATLAAAEVQQLYYHAYQAVLQTLKTRPDHQLLKIWHYLPAINAGSGDDEHYRQFCAGRQQALDEDAQLQRLPAATAIGIPDANMPALFYWLSSTSQMLQNIENPRQVHAWEYPREYGPRSPNFSRATLCHDSQQLFISGTASVVGHRTAHPHATPQQTTEMLANLERLLHSAREHSSQVPALTALRGPLRLYLREPHDWPAVAQQCRQHGLDPTRLVVCHGHVCRADLMVELDGVEALSTGNG